MKYILQIVSALSFLIQMSCTTSGTYKPSNPPSQSAEVKTERNTSVVKDENQAEKPADNTPSTKMKTYSTNLYSISYPSDWICAEHPNDFVDVAFGQEVGIAYSVFHVDIDASLKDIVESGNSDMKSQMNATVVSHNKIKLCNIDAYKTIFTFVIGNGLKNKQISYTLKKGNTYYNIRFNGSVQDIDKNAELIETIIESFKLMQ